MSNGTIIEDPLRFPSGMRALAAAVQARGLKFGLYTSQTSLTCQQRPGSYEYEAIDIARYCDFGLDYIKVRRGRARARTCRRASITRASPSTPS